MPKSRSHHPAKEPTPSPTPTAHHWRAWMPALGAGYGVIGIIPARACSGWSVRDSLLVFFGGPALFTLLELVSHVVKAHTYRQTMVDSQTAELMQELRSDRANMKSLLAMLAAALGGATSDYADQSGGGLAITAQPSDGKPRHSRSRARGREGSSSSQVDLSSLPSGPDS